MGPQRGRVVDEEVHVGRNPRNAFQDVVQFEGEQAPDPMILGMNWYVKGIDDRLTQ